MSFFSIFIAPLTRMSISCLRSHRLVQSSILSFISMLPRVQIRTWDYLWILFFGYSLSIFFTIFLRCGCDECVTSRQEDSLRHSRSRINAYRALASPSLIALSSKDPILTAFELSWELRRLSFLEHEFKVSFSSFFFFICWWFVIYHAKNILKVFKFRQINYARDSNWDSEKKKRLNCKSRKS